MKHSVKLSAFVITTLFTAVGAFAAVNKTANIAVTANIMPACTITATPLAFGTYDPLGVNATLALSMSSAVTVQCVAELPAVVTLDEGINKAAGSTPITPVRRMQCLDNDQEFLNYSLYQDAGYTKAWGTGANEFAFTSDGLAHDYTVYGRIPAGQVLEDGGFSDTIVATLTY